MPKITTADCRNWLVASPKVQQLIRDRTGTTDGDPDPDAAQWIAWGKNPKKWKRNCKYKVGSKTDLEGADSGAGGGGYGDAEGVEMTKQFCGVDPTGGVIRNFWLEGTDHVTIAVLEKDGNLYLLEDLSD